MSGHPTCKDCGATLSLRTRQKIAAGRPTTGQCLSCWRETHKIPQAHCRDCSAPISRASEQGRCHGCANRRMQADPERQARRIAAIRAAMHRPEVQAIKIATVRKNAEKRVGWCPPHYRDEYKRLRRRWGCARRARAEIESRLTPFERQLAKVMAGASLVTVQPLRTAANQRIDRSVLL